MMTDFVKRLIALQLVRLKRPEVALKYCNPLSQVFDHMHADDHMCVKYQLFQARMAEFHKQRLAALVWLLRAAVQDSAEGYYLAGQAFEENKQDTPVWYWEQAHLRHHKAATLQLSQFYARIPYMAWKYHLHAAHHNWDPVSTMIVVTEMMRSKPCFRQKDDRLPNIYEMNNYIRSLENDTNAQLKLAQVYEKGVYGFLPKNEDRAQKLYQRLPHSPLAQWKLYKMQTRKGQADLAHQSLRRAAELDHLEAMHLWATHLQYSPNGKPETAFLMFFRAGGKGHPQALTQVGEYYEHGQAPVTRNLPKAFDTYVKAAELGHTKAMLKVANFYEHGTVPVRVNPQAAFEWTTKACNAKFPDAEAYLRLAGYYLKGYGVAKDAIKHAQYVEKAAALNFVEAFVAQAKLALLHQDRKYWYLRAAHYGNAEAQVWLADAYLHGYHSVIQINYQLAWTYLRKVLGHDREVMASLRAKAHYLISECHYYARGTAQSFDKGYFHLRKASDLGHAQAALLMGRLCLKSGRWSDAWTHLFRAAQKNIAEACRALSELYLKGVLTTGVDREQAAVYREKAFALEARASNLQ